MSAIVLKQPTSVYHGRLRISTELVSKDSTRVLWFELDEAYASAVNVETLDAFLVGALVPAMMSGEDVRVEGPVSSRLFYNLTYSYIPLMRCLFPDLAPIRLFAEELTDRPVRRAAGAVVTGYTGGVDSFCTIFDHMPGAAPDAYRITHLLLNNSGSYGRAQEGRRLFRERLTRLSARTPLGLPLIGVDSNLDEIIGTHFQLTHTIRNLIFPLLLQKLVGKYLYSSGWSFGACSARPSHDIGTGDPMMVHLLSTESLECLSSGARFTRFEKTRRVAEFPPAHDALDVCIDPSRSRGRPNCSICSKCLRTQLTLEVIGKLDLFADVFDLDLYRRVRFPYLISVLNSKDPLLTEIAAEISAGAFPVPLAARLLATLRPRRLTYGMLTRAITRSREPSVPERAREPMVMGPLPD